MMHSAVEALATSHRTMGSLGGHQGSFIFSLSNLRMPVLVSMALNFTRLDVSWI